MGEDSKIEWTDHTFNPWVGCVKVSAECKHCYAEVGTIARVSKSRGLPLWGPGSTRHVTSDSNWKQPLKWNRDAEKAGVRRRVFCASMSDVAEVQLGTEAGAVMDAARVRLWALIEATPWLDWLLLSKRPENFGIIFPVRWTFKFSNGGMPPNVWLGTTAGTQATADERIPKLMAYNAAVLFVSMEPLLEKVSFALVPGLNRMGAALPDWIIVGGESGPHARPTDVGDIEHVVAQCDNAGVAVLVKQLGAVAFEVTKRGRTTSTHTLPLQHPKGGDINEWPEHLRVRQYPTPRRAA